MDERAKGGGGTATTRAKLSLLFATTPRAVSDEVNDELYSVIKCALPSVLCYRNVAIVAKQRLVLGLNARLPSSAPSML